MASEYEDRKSLTFEQAEGAEALPIQLNLGELSEFAPTTVGYIPSNVRVLDGFQNLNSQLMDLLHDWHVTRRLKAADEFRAASPSSGEPISRYHAA